MRLINHKTGYIILIHQNANICSVNKNSCASVGVEIGKMSHYYRHKNEYNCYKKGVVLMNKTKTIRQC